MSLWWLSLALLSALLSLLCIYLERTYSYWARRGVLYDKPVWFYGNLRSVGRTTTVLEPFRRFYEKYKGRAPFGGFYFALRGAAVLLDLELVKLVMVKDFHNFAHRGNYYNEADDPISAHLFNLDGRDWREMRNRLTPTFTSLKMHQMLPTVVEIANRFVKVVQQKIEPLQHAEESPVMVKDLLARFTMDVIGSCAFGLECNSLNDPNDQFCRLGQRTFQERRHGRLAFAFMQAFPQLARRLHFKMVQDDVSAFFMSVVRETLDYRDKHQVQRNDFLNLLMELRNDPNGGLTFNQIAAQAFVFFLGGFETSSSTMGFALHLLALHPEVQQRGREEVQQVFAKHKELNYEALRDLKYIKQIVYETLRKYSIASILIRMTIEDYEVPGTDYVLEAGTPLVIPVDAIHHDPDIYPEPEKFDPDRFTPEAIEERHSAAWLGFGAGPRNCIGLRFGEMQTLVGLAVLLKNFKFSAAKDTEIPLRINKTSFFLQSEGGIVLNVQKV
ncbi:cytochrome P450 6A1 [Drosophila grimshawi]|uniref:GH20769 n=1 Tax=Drosophila grimshawi TaxID=7222 RepID=B4J6B4_DROGR|nr:cytochrome P450 6A1 [Drosophila grimshawi]EDW00887.1 GH20769 [Drosophila grimshawi]